MTLYLRRDVWKGKRGEKAFAEYLRQVFQHEDIEVWNNPINFEGVDIIIKDRNGKPIKVFEVTNYAKTSKMSKPRARRYRNSLNFWKNLYPNIYRAIVVSYPETVDKIKGVRKIFEDEGIEVWVFK